MVELALNLKTVAIKNSTYLLVPKDIARLLDIEKNPSCTVTVRLQENECSLIYSFQKLKEPEQIITATESYLLP